MRCLSSIQFVAAVVAALPLVAPGIQVQSVQGDRIVLPLELVAGEPATLAVLMPNGHVSANTSVILSNGTTLTTDESGRAHFLVPTKPEILYAQILGTEKTAAAYVRPREGTGDLHIQAVPRLSPLEQLLRIHGSGFKGDADRNRVTIGEKQALVLAASPVELVIVPPARTEAGTAELDLSDGGQNASASIALIRIEATPPKIPPRKKTKVTIRVFGTTEAVTLELHDLDPEVVQFVRGDNLRVQTHSGSDNSVRVEVKGLRTGDFSYAVRLEPEIEAAEIPLASRFLEEVGKIAAPAEKALFEKILREMNKKKPDASVVRRDLQSLTPLGSSGDYGALIRATKEALFGP